MRIIAFIALLLSISNASKSQDFITGFLLAMRLTEKVQHVFPCVMQVDQFKQAVAKAEALIDGKNVRKIVDAGQVILNAFDKAYPQCGEVAVELTAYVHEIKSIIFADNFPKLVTFRLLKYHNHVNQDLKEYNEAKAAGDYLTAGMRIGDIGRIIVWGSPNQMMIE